MGIFRCLKTGVGQPRQTPHKVRFSVLIIGERLNAKMEYSSVLGLKVQMLQFHSAVLAVMQVKLKFFTLANVNC